MNFELESYEEKVRKSYSSEHKDLARPGLAWLWSQACNCGNCPIISRKRLDERKTMYSYVVASTEGAILLANPLQRPV